MDWRQIAVMRLLMIFLCCSVFLVSCAAFRKRPESPIPAPITTTTLQEKIGVKPYGPSSEALLSAILPWLGTPYRYGGNDRSGVDCSGFIYQVFRDAYGLQLPRQTSQLAKAVSAVSQNKLREGDLVFFTINTKEAGHAGIYLNDGAFIHASTSRGVMVSRLSEPYWQRYFTGAGRVGQLTNRP